MPTPTLIAPVTNPDPPTGVTTDAAGDIFGANAFTGAGSVYEIVNTSTGYASTQTILVTFNYHDGIGPSSILAIDAAGDIFGTTNAGGTAGNGDGGGTVFEIPNTSTGYASTPITLVNFNGPDGEAPRSGVIIDAAGDLFGATVFGGANGDGTVFEIVNTPTGYASSLLTLASFTIPDDGFYGVLLPDAAGNFFITSAEGGTYGDGAVLEIADTGNGYAVRPVVNFDGTDGRELGPYLNADSAGNVYGMASFGGGAFEIAGSGFQPAPAPSSPTVESIAAFPATGDATTGTLVTLTVTMSETVAVSGGLPSVTLNDGGSATYDAAASGGTTMVFDYTVQRGQNTSALAVTGVNANGATIQDGSGDIASFVRPPETFAGLAVNFATLATFDFANPGDAGPEGGLITDAAGDLFGTTVDGGANDDGEVFEIARTGTGYAATPATLASFNISDGYLPTSGLIADAAGNLFGTTVEGGPFGGPTGDGTVFEIVNTSTGYASTPTPLVSFNRADGAFPYPDLIMDGNGDLLGTTSQGGPNNGSGTVFEIPYDGGIYASTPTTLATFTFGLGIDGGSGLPGNLIADAAGNLFGITDAGGPGGYGTVFEIANTSTGYASAPATLVSFDGANGYGAVGNLVADAAGDIFGATGSVEGGINASGTVFEIVNTSTGYASTPTTLVTFHGQDGYSPNGLIIDFGGNLFGATSAGGTDGDGTVFEIGNTSTGYATTPTTLINFNGADGSQPAAALIADSAGDLFGTTPSGANGNGTVFELTDTAFQVSCYRRGTRIATPTGERFVEALAVGDAVLTVSGQASAIVWIGRRRVDCRHHPAPEKVWPVRVRAGALGQGLPRRDLWLSPDHAVFVDDVLIPIKHLANGVTIRQVPGNEVVYYHIELSEHDVLLAEGLPAESYLDTGGRRDFDDDCVTVALYPDFAARRWESAGYAQLIVAGSRLQAVRQRVNALAHAAATVMSREWEKTTADQFA